jgi:FixJ family two-component response regulator
MPHTIAHDRPKVLLAEDDPGVRRSLQLLLQGRGYDVRSYASGRALLADPAATDAACFVGDFRMPDLNGLEILRALRLRGWDRPAVLITAFNTSDLARRAQAEGFSSVIEKPLLDHVLTDTVARLVS